MTWLSKVGRLAVPSLIIFSATNAFAQKFIFTEGATARVDALTRGTEIPGAVSIHLTVPQIDVDRTSDGFDRITVPGLVPSTAAGQPELGTTGVLVAVPAGFEPVLTVTRHEQRFVNDVLCTPAQKQFRCSTERKEPFQFNSALYRSDATYPAAAVALEEIGHLQSVRLVRVALNPVRQHFGSRRLEVSTDLAATVTFRKVADARTTRLPKALRSIVHGFVANGDLVRADVSGQETMLIVVADSLKASIQPLVDWKRAKGMKVDVATVTEAGGTKDKIKTYIQTYYDAADPKPSYLIVVGNKTTAPTHSESTGSGSAASDWRYSLLAGNDDVPDVLYGRLAADNVDEVKTQIEKWIAYEKSPIAGDWFSKGLTIASSEGSNPSDKEYAEQIQEALKAGSYSSVDGFYQGEQSATAANIKGGVNEGRSWMAYFGHGSGTSWGSTNDTFNNTTVGTLKNGAKLPIIIDVACQNGSWVALSKCFGKAWVTQKDGGAVGFLGGSVNISWHPPAVMSVGIAKTHFEKPVPTLGGSWIAGQLYLVEKMGANDETLDNMKWYNLLGDPSLLIRTATPVAYELKHAVRQKSGRLEVSVTAVDDAGKGVAGLLTSLNRPNGDSIAVGKTNESGEAVLSVAGMGQLENDSKLTVTGYNAETKQILVQ